MSCKYQVRQVITQFIAGVQFSSIWPDLIGTNLYIEISKRIEPTHSFKGKLVIYKIYKTFGNGDTTVGSLSSSIVSNLGIVEGLWGNIKGAGATSIQEEFNFLIFFAIEFE